MKKKTVFIILGSSIAFLLLLLFGFFVAKRMYSSSYQYYDSRYGYVDGALPSQDYLLSNKGDTYEEVSLAPDEMVNNQEGSKLQKSGSMSLLVENIDEAISSMRTVNSKYSAQITNIYDHGRGNDRYVQITTKVEVKDFEKYYESLREIEGEVVDANISTTDVTEEYIDITARLKNLSSTEEQLVEIMKSADTVTDILAVQKELNTVRGEIESYEQRKRYFDSQTDYSYMSVTFSVDKTGLNVTEEEWKPWGEFKSAVKSLLDVLKGFVNLLIWLVVFSPIVLIPFFVVRYIIRKKRVKKAKK
jgi:hypothetical protein